MSETLLIECLKVAANTVSPSVDNRIKCIAEATNMLYASLSIEVNTDKSQEESPRRGRPPKPR